MHWYAVIAAAYLAGLTEFVCLCHEAPLAEDDPLDALRDV